MNDQIVNVETFIASIEREVPYLGPLVSGESVNDRGYVVRKGNGTIYPTCDRSVIVKVTTEEGLVGWGETYGICAPKAVCEIIADLLAPTLINRNPLDVSTIWDDLYNMMRVRGCFGGFYVDSIAALDIALWDIVGKMKHVPLYKLLGDKQRRKIPAYISGLPEATLAGRIDLAQKLVDQGFNAIKFAAVVSHDGIVNEMAALREALGDSVELMVDLHWKFPAEDAVNLIKRLEPYSPKFVEAPVKPEDIKGLRYVSENTSVPIAAGEEWRTEYEASMRLTNNSIKVIQPEMGHTGITQFMRIAELAEQHGCHVAPHATIGIGIFMAASLHASCAIKSTSVHEYQHSVFDRNLAFIDTTMNCDSMGYCLPDGDGLGVGINDRLWPHMVQYS